MLRSAAAASALSRKREWSMPTQANVAGLGRRAVPVGGCAQRRRRKTRQNANPLRLFKA